MGKTKKNHKFNQIKKIMKPFIFEEIICCITLLIYSGTSILFPYFFKLIIDDSISKADINSLIRYGGLMIITIVIMVVSNYIQAMRFLKLGQRFIISIKKSIIENLTNYSNNFFKKYNNGDILSILQSDVNNIEELAIHMVSDILANLVTVVGIFAIICTISWQMTIILIILSILYTLLQRRCGIAIKKQSISLSRCRGELVSKTQEFIDNLINIKVLNCFKFFEDKYINKHNEFFSCERNVMVTNQNSIIISTIFQSFALIMVLAYGGVMVIKGDMSIGILFSVTLYVQKIYGPIIQLASSYIKVKKIQASIKRVYDLINEKEDIIEEGSLEFKDSDAIDISLNNFSYGYDNKVLVNKANIVINEGSKVSIMGENGCGKTTLFKLLLRLQKNYDGDIFIGKHKIQEYKTESIRKNILCITQRPFIFNGTIRENILINNVIDEDQLDNIIKSVHLEADIAKFPEGLNTIVGEKGIELSGGQAQKITLARAFVSKAKIIILDEPTSALDLNSEELVCKNIFTQMSEKTIISITHRKEILKYCNKMLEISNQKFNEYNEVK